MAVRFRAGVPGARRRRAFASSQPRLVAWLAALVSLVLAVTLLESWQPAVAQAAPSPVAVVPAAPSGPQGPLERPDQVSAAVTARVAKARVEVTGLRSETTQVFAQPDGTFSMESYAKPVRVRRGDGSWTPVDTDLAATGDGWVAPGATPVGVRFSDGGPGPLVQISEGGRSLAAAWPGGDLPRPTLSGDTATYAEVWPGVDLTLRAAESGFSQVLVVKTRQAALLAALRRVSFPLATVGVTAGADANGNLRATDAGGREVFVGSTPRMWDSSGPTGRDSGPGGDARGPGESTRQVVMGTEVTAGSVSITPPLAALTDPGTVFPLYLDPGYSTVRSAWTMIDSGFGNTSYYNSTDDAKSGTYDGGAHKLRSLFRMNTAPLAGKHVLSASFSIYNTGAWNCTASPVEIYQTPGFSSSTTWNNFVGWPATPITTVSAAHGEAGCPSANIGFPITGTVQSAANSALGSLTLGLKAPSETTNGQWKRYYSGNPTLVVSYNSYPGVPTSLSMTPCYTTCSSPAITSSLQATLKAKVSDADGTAQRVEFEVWNAAKDTKVAYTAYSVTGIPVGGTASWMQNTARANNTTYNWKVRSCDPTDCGNWSGWFTFTTDATAPAAAPTVSSTDYPEGAWSGNIGQAGVFSLSAPGLSDLGGFLWGLDQPSPTTDVRTTTTATITVTPTANHHILYVRSKDKAGNLGPVKAYEFFAGLGGLVSPEAGGFVAEKQAVALIAPPGITGATLQWRRGDADVWTTVPTADVVLAVGGGSVTWPVTGSGEAFPKLTWDVAKTVNDAEAGPDPLRGPLQVRLTYTGGPGGTSNTTRLTVDPRRASAASDEAGPGSVNLLTGDLTVADSDVSVDAYGSDLTVTRTYNTRRYDENLNGVFGPGWTSGVAVDEADSDYRSLAVTGSLVQVGTADGDSVGFTKNPSGTYTPEVGLEDLKLTYTSGTDTYVLSDLDGNVVTFTKPTGADATTPYAPSAVQTPGTAQTTALAWEAVAIGGEKIARPTRMLAPSPAGVACTTGNATTTRGCRSLGFTYATTTTATGTAEAQWGDYTGRLTAVTVTAWDPDLGTPAMRTITLARYAYDNTGRLRAAWDPRLDCTDGTGAHHLQDSYRYNGDGVLDQVTPNAEKPYDLTYTTIPGDTGKGRLVQVTRWSTPTATTKTTVVYKVPVSGTGAPYNLASTETARWGQAEAPTDATAVYPATQIPSGDQATGTMPSSYDRATVAYLDANGQQINTAAPGGGITTTEYDLYGNPTRTLTAGNRQRALDQGTDIATEADLAGKYSTLTVYEVNTAGGRRVKETFGPLHDTSLPSGTTYNTNQARSHITNTYDQSAPVGGPYDLITTTVTGARPDGTATDVDTRTTTTTYDWTLRLPLVVTTDSGGLNYTNRTTYDTATGLPLTVTTPAGAATTNTPRTTKTTYYTADATAAYAECRNRPEWANLACRAEAGGAPSAGNPIPASVVTYDLFNQTRTIVEKNPTSGTVLRTTTVTYDSVNRALTSEVSAPGLGQTVPKIKTVYETATGRAVRTQSLDTAGTVTAELVRGYDELGRPTTYTDADNNTSTTTYDQYGRTATTSDGKGTQTLTYDGGTERRGLVTSMTDSQAGTFTAGYDPDGELIAQTLPNSLVATTTLDETGTATGLRYATAGCVTDDCEYYAETIDETVHSQTATRGSTQSAQTYGYDKVGRLTRVADTLAEGGCTTRTYGFDTATNRTAQNTYDPNPTDGACQTTTAASTRTWAYDTADRATSTGYTYDTLGRTTTVPATDTQTPSGGNLTAAYHTTDLVRTITAGGRTTTYTLDVNTERIRTWTDYDGTTTTTKKHHYDADTDNPAWTDEGASRYTRTIVSIAGDLSAIYDSGPAATVFQLANLHGDLIATTGANLTTQPGLLTTNDPTEYGLQRNPGTAGSTRYGWLGAEQRAADTPTGTTIMGVRLYNPGTGRFLQTDPVPGGSCNDYEYTCADPVNGFDLDGRRLAYDRTGQQKPAAGERRACALRMHIIHCYNGGRLAVYFASKWQNRIFGYITDGTRSNAFRHAYWSALMTVMMGSRRARIIGNNHERYSNDRQNQAFHDMDYKNNRAGRVMGSRFRVRTSFWSIAFTRGLEAAARWLAYYVLARTRKPTLIWIR